MFERRNLLRTVLAAAWSFVVVGVVWLRLSPFYEGWLVAGTNFVLPAGLMLEHAGTGLAVRVVYAGRDFAQGFDPLLLHSGIVIVLALVAATPGRSMRWRAAAVVVVAGALFALQVSAMASFAFALRNAAGGGLGLGEVLAGFAIFWALTPLVVGGAWAYHFWLPGLSAGSATLDGPPVDHVDRGVGAA